MRIEYKDIGSRIREERTKQNISQERLAELADVGTTHISHIETGNTIPSMKTFIAIINALRISADKLLRNSINQARHIFEGELAEVMGDCTDDETRIIVDMAKTLKTSLRRKQDNT